MTSPANNQPSARVPELDGIRGLAILLVVFHHYIYGAVNSQPHGLPALVRLLSPLSWSGVDLFFVLSGFLIGGILMDQRESGNYFKTFYIRRVCRIIPLYFVWLALFFVLAWALSPGKFSDLYATLFGRDIPHFPHWGYFLFLQNLFTAKSGLFGSPWLAVTWSLAVEEQFYLLLPLALWLIAPRIRWPILLVLIALVPLLRTFLYLFHPELFIYVLLPCRADSLLLGVLCAYLVRDPVRFSRLKSKYSWLPILFCLLLSGMMGLTACWHGNDIDNFNKFDMATWGFTWIALFYACLLMLTLRNGSGPLARIFRNRLLQHFGLIAYGMFLMHLAIDTLAHHLILGKSSEINTPSDLAVTALAFVITWLLAVLSWNFFEKPIIRWGHSFRYHPGDNAVPEPAVSTAAPNSLP